MDFETLALMLLSAAQPAANSIGKSKGFEAGQVCAAKVADSETPFDDLALDSLKVTAQAFLDGLDSPAQAVASAASFDAD